VSRRPQHPSVVAAEKYCREVIAGRIPACKWTRLACQRHIDDRRREKSAKFRYRFDKDKAERVARFIQLLPHIKGKWARKDPRHPDAHRIKLAGWQLFVVCSIFGWVKKKSGLRRFRKASLYVARKNGKSTLGGGIGWWMFAKDGEIGAEVYSGATTEKQAWEVFGPARRMAINEPELPEGLGITVGAQTLSNATDGSKFEPVIGKPGDGASPHLAIVDEYHEHDTAVLYDTMETGMGARDQPLMLVISTAGENLAGPCYDDWLTVKKILERTLEEEEHFGVIYTIDEDDDWTSEIALRKANPNYGISVGAEFLQSQIRHAITNARKQGSIKTKHLNLWVQARDAYFNMQAWGRCARPGLKLEDFAKRRCYLGIDLASKIDIAGLEFLFPDGDDKWIRFGKYYLPEETVEQPENEHYRKWAREGWITVTEGNMIDYGRILDDIVAAQSQFEIAELAFDPHQATMLVTELMSEGVPCVEFRPTVLNFSEPMKHIDALVMSSKLGHNNDPVMTWQMSNVVAKVDAKDNVYPRKERPENKIDNVVALIQAMGRAMSQTAQPQYQMVII
jgi:phage terminase large subunit-like protein